MGTFVANVAAPDTDAEVDAADKPLMTSSCDALLAFSAAAVAAFELDLGSVKSSAPSALNASALSSARSSAFGSSLTFTSAFESSAAAGAAESQVASDSLFSAFTFSSELKAVA